MFVELRASVGVSSWHEWGTDCLIELVHLSKDGELPASLEDFFVLWSMGLLCKWVQIMFLDEHLS